MARASRPKPDELAGCPRLLAAVKQRWLRGRSPEQISARLRRDHSVDLGIRISHETNYRSLFVQSHGELLRQLSRKLRTGRPGGCHGREGGA